jgi:hypothetical protein
MKSSAESKNTVEILWSKLDQSKNRISCLEDMADVLEHADENIEKNVNKKYMQDLWDTFKRPNLWIIGI